MHAPESLKIPRRWLPDTLAAIGLLAVAVLLLSDTIIPLRWLLYAGDFPQYYTYEMAFRAGLAHGSIPLWNVYFADPLIGSAQSEVLYPGMLLTRLIPLPQAFTWGAGLHIWLAGLGVYALLRDLGARRPAALLGGVAYMLSASMLEHLIAGHTTQINGMAWMGWMILAYRRLLITRQWRYLVATTLSVACFVLTGHIQWVLTGLIVVVAFGLLAMGREARRRDWPTLRQSLTQSILVTLFAAGLVAVFALPAAEYLGLSTRGIGLSFGDAADYSVTPAQLLTLPAPQARIAAGGTVNAADETLAYTGLMALGLAVLALFSPDAEQRKFAWLFIGLDILSLLLALGGYLPTYRLIYAITASMRAPSRYLLIWAFCTPVLAGLGLEATLRRAESGMKSRGWVLWVGLGIVGLIVVMGMVGPVSTPAAVIVAAIALVGWALALAARRWLKESRWAWVMVAAMLVDMFGFSWLLAAPGVMNSIPYYDLFFKPGSNPYLGLNIDPSSERLWGGDGGEPWTLATAFGVPVLGRDIQGTSHFIAELIRPSAHEAALSASGYQILVDTPTPDGASVVREAGPASLIALDDNLPRVYATYAIRLVKDPARSLRAVTNPSFDPAQQTVVLDPDGRFDMAPFSAYGPPFRADIQVLAYEPNRITARVDSDTAAMVVFVEPYYPGWWADIDGSPAEIWQVNHAFRGVVVPSGTHTITMTYQPDSVRNGAWISAATGLVLLALTLWQIGRRLKPLENSSAEKT